MGANLAVAASRLESLQLVACVDPDESATQRAARNTSDARTYASVEGLLEAQNAAIDAVLVATPHDELARSSLAAIHAGKHVMVEKPMAMNAAEALEIERAAAEAGVTCMVGYSRRFSTGRYVRDLLAAGHVGALRSTPRGSPRPTLSPTHRLRPRPGLPRRLAAAVQTVGSQRRRDVVRRHRIGPRSASTQ